MVKNFSEIINKAKKQNQKTVVIAAAQSVSAIEAAVHAKKENIANSLLIGDMKAIENILKEKFPDFANAFEIEDTGTDLQKTCKKSIAAVREKRADIILKGTVDTAILLREVLDKDAGLATGDVISDVLAFETKDRLILMSDGGIVTYPNLKEKIAIIKNAVKIAHAFDNTLPKVALLAAVEVVNPKMECTVDAAIISKMNQRNQIKGCIIDGPLAFDNAIDLEAAKIKGIESDVAGNADILIFPNIESANIFAKTLTYYANFKVAHVVVGAQAPILIPSRADTAENKMLCIAMAAL